jgi:putative toxin-antitoxin system antitoxin component (TIGR02293 family)
MPRIAKEPSLVYAPDIGITRDPRALDRHARAGVRKEYLLRVLAGLGVTRDDFETVLPVSLRTVQRHRDADVLSPVLSEHVLHLAEVLRAGGEIFGSEEVLARWLRRTNIAIGGVEPLTLLRTRFGIEVVLDELGRLAHGVHA